MKLFILSILLGSFTVTAALAVPSTEVETVAQRPNDVFVPQGYDDNDNVLALTAGVFSNLCYKIAPPVVRYALAEHKIYIDNQIYVIGKCYNALMYIPYSNPVNLGILPQGEYELLVSDGKGGYETRATIPVTAAKPSLYGSDSQLYAPIKEIQFIPNRRDRKNPRLLLKGTFTNNCMEIDTIEVKQTSADVVEILPIAKVRERSSCRARAVPFEREIVIKDFPSGEAVLVHVRTLGGQALNRLITFVDRFDVRF